MPSSPGHISAGEDSVSTGEDITTYTSCSKTHTLTAQRELQEELGLEVSIEVLKKAFLFSTKTDVVLNSGTQYRPSTSVTHLFLGTYIDREIIDVYLLREKLLDTIHSEQTFRYGCGPFNTDSTRIRSSSSEVHIL
jgi:8-oxo-dGTP pyrophosphatase MutT (NUDIX family)